MPTLAIGSVNDQSTIIVLIILIKFIIRFLFQLTGVPLQGGKRVQFNMFLKSINRITITENLTTVLMPAIWVEEVSIRGSL